MTPRFTKKIAKRIVECVANYRSMEKTVPNSDLLREVKWQYKDMASGGDGGHLGFVPADYVAPDAGNKWADDYVSVREYNYPNMPNSFFQEVRDLLGWQ